MPEQELSVEAQEALAATRLGGLKKKINAAGWSDNMEDLLKAWGEKSAGLRFMHNKAGGYWKGVSNRLTLWGILITTLASAVSLVATNIEDPQTKNGVLYSVGGIGMISSLIQLAKVYRLGLLKKWKLLSNRTSSYYHLLNPKYPCEKINWLRLYHKHLKIEI